MQSWSNASKNLNPDNPEDIDMKKIFFLQPMIFTMSVNVRFAINTDALTPDISAMPDVMFANRSKLLPGSTSAMPAAIATQSTRSGFGLFMNFKSGKINQMFMPEPISAFGIISVLMLLQTFVAKHSLSRFVVFKYVYK